MDHSATREQPASAAPFSTTLGVPASGAFAQPSSSSPSPSSSAGHRPPCATGADDARNGREEDEQDRAAGAAPRGLGRPSSFDRSKLTAIYAFIRQTGVSDTAAAAMVGVTRSTLSRWKAEHEEAACELERARTEYLLPRLKIIGETRRKDGELDWRAQAWLIKFANPEEYGPPSRRRKVKEVEVPLSEEEQKAAVLAQGCAEWAEWMPGDPLSPAMIVALQEKRQQMIREMDPEWYDADVAAEQATRAKHQKKWTPEERKAYFDDLQEKHRQIIEKAGNAARPTLYAVPPQAFGGEEAPAGQATVRAAKKM